MLTPEARLLLDSALARVRDEGHVIWGFCVKPQQDELEFETFCSNTASRARFCQMTADALAVLSDTSVPAEAVETGEPQVDADTFIDTDGREHKIHEA